MIDRDASKFMRDVYESLGGSSNPDAEAQLNHVAAVLGIQYETVRHEIFTLDSGLCVDVTRYWELFNSYDPEVQKSFLRDILIPAMPLDLFKHINKDHANSARVDDSIPCLAIELHNGMVQVVDGWHRLWRRRQKAHIYMPCYAMPYDFIVPQIMLTDDMFALGATFDRRPDGSLPMGVK